jgi:hypothetical protein
MGGLTQNQSEGQAVGSSSPKALVQTRVCPFRRHEDRVCKGQGGLRRWVRAGCAAVTGSKGLVTLGGTDGGPLPGATAHRSHTALAS